jgi:hypothetical protein
MKRSTLLSTGTPLLVAAAAVFALGDLNPPAGSVAASGKRLTEIEPRIAINATNTPGDADSIFKITQPGSYYLTGNITGVAGKHGIEIAASNVSIDLNGFVVDGGGVIGGSLDGIRTSLSVLSALTITNGKVSNWGGDGIDLATGSSYSSLVERVEAIGNGATGMQIGFTSVIDRCTARSNGARGFLSLSGCSISNCTSSENGSIGFQIGSISFASACVASNNDSHGLSASFDSTIRDCVAIGNTGIGILGSYSSILDCTANLNGGSGIQIGTACIARGNTCSSNCTTVVNSAGITVLGSDNRIEDNNCTQQNNLARGIDVNGTGNIIVRNTCSGNTTNWDIVAGNVCGPILDRTAPASAAILGNSAPDSTGSTHPNANFTY